MTVAIIVSIHCILTIPTKSGFVQHCIDRTSPTDGPEYKASKADLFPMFLILRDKVVKPDVKLSVLIALRNYAGSIDGFYGILIDSVCDESPAVRHTGLYCLYRIKKDISLKIAFTFLADDSDEVIYAAARLISAYGTIDDEVAFGTYCRNIGVTSRINVSTMRKLHSDMITRLAK